MQKIDTEIRKFMTAINVSTEETVNSFSKTQLVELLASVVAQMKQLKQWIIDMQQGCYVNCVYCGHRYGPYNQTPVSQADILKAHIEQCPEHPMSFLKKENEELKQQNQLLRNQLSAKDKP